MPAAFHRRNQYANLLSHCFNMDFAPVHLSDHQKAFLSDLDTEITSFCRSLTRSAQTDAILFFMELSKTLLGNQFHFFANYYPPSWSIIYWLIHSEHNTNQLTQEEIAYAKTAHCMAMFLHVLDDHLMDFQVEISHLTLLLRSHAWLLLNRSLSNLALDFEHSSNFIQESIDDYYYSMRLRIDTYSLDEYCELFVRQMAIAVIVPFLLARKISFDDGFSRAVRSAYTSFGIAWRLLDDLNDIEQDMLTGTRSSVYVLLPRELKDLWDKTPELKDEANDSGRSPILDYLLKENIIGFIENRIRTELDSAISTSERCRMKGLAQEFRCLVGPLKKSSWTSLSG